MSSTSPGNVVSGPGTIADRLPHDPEAERAVLGALLLDPGALLHVIEKLRADHFYLESHRIVYRACLDLHEKAEAADLVTVRNHLNEQGRLEQVGGVSYLSSLVDSLPDVANVIHYAEIVHDKAVKRQLMAAAQRILTTCSLDHGEAREAVESAQKDVFRIAEDTLSGGLMPIRELTDAELANIEAARETRSTLTGLDTGFVRLNELTSGLQRKDLVILAARPSMGKTSLGVNICAHAAIRGGKKVAIFSLEMAAEQLVRRLLSAEARVDQKRIAGGYLAKSDWPKLELAAQALREVKLWIDDTPGITALELSAKARRLKQERGLDLVMVDYMQLMSGGARFNSRNEEVSAISRSLKGVAKELDVPMLVLSQLSRQPERRGGDHRPQLSDLRESGCLTADTTIFRADTNQRVTIAELLEEKAEDIPVWSIDDRRHIVPRTMSRVFSSGTKKVFRLKLASGREVKASANHPFLTIEGWKRLDQLDVRSRVAVPRTLPDPLETIRWPEERIVLLAHLIGDGSFVRRQPMRYATQSEENVEAVTKAARAFGVTAKGGWDEQAHSYQIRLPAPYRLTHGKRNPIAAWLDDLGLFGCRSHEKHVPRQVFSFSRDDVALFLRHLWATDGHISVRRVRGRKNVALHYSTNSRRLADDVAALLLRFGIVSRTKTNQKESNRPGHIVWITGAEDQRRFFGGIGAFGPREAPARKASAVLDSITTNTNVDTIPRQIWIRVKERLAEIGMTHRQYAAALGGSFGGSSMFSFSPSRPYLERVAAVVEDDHLSTLARSDVFWDEVLNIEDLGQEEVFDATVEGTHNFIADGIVVHNSIEQDADVVMFIIRPSVYDREAEDPRRAELMIAKQRNGPIGEIDLVFQHEFTRFENADFTREDGDAPW
jgi:replicative DNA helicase